MGQAARDRYLADLGSVTEDDQALQHRVCENAAASKTYATAVDWLTQEARHLRKCSQMHDTAVARLQAVLSRCEGAAVQK